MKRNANAVWLGTGKDGKGTLSSQSGVLQETQYSYTSRFENGIGTNPEELIAAAHAGCFNMKLAFVLNGAGFTADKLDTSCTIDFVDGVVVSSHLILNAVIPEISKDKFDECVTDAKINCPISKLFNTQISVEASLTNS